MSEVRFILASHAFGGFNAARGALSAPCNGFGIEPGGKELFFVHFPEGFCVHASLPSGKYARCRQSRHHVDTKQGKRVIYSLNRLQAGIMDWAVCSLVRVRPPTEKIRCLAEIK